MADFCLASCCQRRWLPDQLLMCSNLTCLYNDYTGWLLKTLLLCVTLTPLNTPCVYECLRKPNGCNSVHYRCGVGFTEKLQTREESLSALAKDCPRRSRHYQQGKFSKSSTLPLFFFTPLRLLRVTHPPGINPHLCDPVFQLLSHEFTLDCLLRMAAKDDLMYCGIRWVASTHHPLKTRSLHRYFKFHHKFKQSDIAHECESTVAVAEAACCVESGQL